MDCYDWRVSLFQGYLYFKGVLFQGCLLFQGHLYFRGVFISGVLFQGYLYLYFRGTFVSGGSLFQKYL